MAATIESVPVSDLDPDRRNPRLASAPDTDRDTFIHMAQSLGPKLVVLAEDIVARSGLNPAVNFIVIPGDGERRVVLDGNRRLTALRVLDQPSILDGAVPDSLVKQVRALHKRCSSGTDGLPVEEVTCIVFDTRAEANDWIELIHEGEQSGAGLVPWSSQQKSRHRENNATAKPYHMQILDFVMAEGTVDGAARDRYDAGKYPVTTLKRLLSTPEVRHMIGVDFENGRVTTRYPKEEVLRGLSRAVSEIGSGQVKVGDVMSKTLRIDYVEGFGVDERPDPTTKGEADVDLDDWPTETAADAGGDGTDGDGGTQSKERTHSSRRKRLIPSDYKLSIPASRINDIYIELKRRLELRSTPNAVSVLFRTFLELSVDDYIEREGVSINLSKNPELAQKVKAVADHMKANKVMGAKELIPIRQALDKTGGGGTLVTTMNQFVHSRTYQPTGPDLAAIWDRFSLFIEKLWA